MKIINAKLSTMIKVKLMFIFTVMICPRESNIISLVLIVLIYLSTCLSCERSVLPSGWGRAGMAVSAWGLEGGLMRAASRSTSHTSSGTTGSFACFRNEEGRPGNI